MTYINLPNQQPDLGVVINILYRDNQLWFQRITQVDDDKFDFIQVPLDRTFTSAVRKTVFLNQSNFHVLDVEDSYGETIIEHYVVDRSDPPRIDSLPDEEAFSNLLIRDDGSLELTISTSEDDGINYLMDQGMLKNVCQFINDTCEDVKRQAMLLTSVTDAEDCGNQIPGKPFECCGKCEVCHCGV